MESLQEQKSEQRRLCIAARRTLTERDRASFSRMICNTLKEADAVRQAGTIFSYMAVWDEVNLHFLHEWADSDENKKNICFPLTFPHGLMKAAIPEFPDAFLTGTFGILSPDPARSVIISPEEIDLILVPCVGFDERGNRLGHGAGYYDRFLVKCPQATKILVAFEAQKMAAIAVEGTDVPMDYVVTEKGLRKVKP